MGNELLAGSGSNGNGAVWSCCRCAQWQALRCRRAGRGWRHSFFRGVLRSVNKLVGGGRADENSAQGLDIALRVKRLMRHKALRHGKLSLSLQYDNAKSATELAWELSCIAGGSFGKI